MLYINVCDGDQLDVLLLTSRERVGQTLTGLKSAGEVEGGIMGGGSSPKTFF